MKFFVATVVALIGMVSAASSSEDAHHKTDAARLRFEEAMNKLRSDKARFDEQATKYKLKAEEERKHVKHRFH